MHTVMGEKFDALDGSIELQLTELNVLRVISELSAAAAVAYRLV